MLNDDLLVSTNFHNNRRLISNDFVQIRTSNSNNNNKAVIDIINIATVQPFGLFQPKLVRVEISLEVGAVYCFQTLSSSLHLCVTTVLTGLLW